MVLLGMVLTITKVGKSLGLGQLIFKYAVLTQKIISAKADLLCPKL